MKNKRENVLSIYIHIPFCIQKCLYCDFLSTPAEEEERERYLAGLEREMREQADKYRDYTIETVFLGGGTPSVLSWRQTERILETLYTNYTVAGGAEMTIEANPGTVTQEKLDAYRRAGLNRISLGLQSAHDGELKNLGRIHTFRDFLDAYGAARKAGFANCNVDVMAAIPGQTPASYEQTLRTVLELQPEHISSYSLILEEGTPFYERYENGGGYPPLPTEEEERFMYVRTGELLAQAGYERYEISNYAKPGFECRHNNVYWQRGNYLGFGSGAASMVENMRWSNCGEERHALSVREQAEEFVFLGMRRMEGISRQEFESTIGTGLNQYFPQAVASMREKGLIEEAGDKIRLTAKGIDVSNYVFTVFLADGETEEAGK